MIDHWPLHGKTESRLKLSISDPLDVESNCFSYCIESWNCGSQNYNHSFSNFNCTAQFHAKTKRHPYRGIKFKHAISFIRFIKICSCLANFEVSVIMAPGLINLSQIASSEARRSARWRQITAIFY